MKGCIKISHNIWSSKNWWINKHCGKFCFLCRLTCDSSERSPKSFLIPGCKVNIGHINNVLWTLIKISVKLLWFFQSNEIQQAICKLRLYRVDWNPGRNSLYVWNGTHRSQWFCRRVDSFYKPELRNWVNSLNKEVYLIYHYICKDFLLLKWIWMNIFTNWLHFALLKFHGKQEEVCREFTHSIPRCHCHQ